MLEQQPPEEAQPALGPQGAEQLWGKQAKPIPEAIARIVQKPGGAWTRPESNDVFEWVMQEKVEGLVYFAYGILRARDPRASLEDALDAVQDKLVDAWHFLPRFDPTRASFLHWLYIMVIRHCARTSQKSAECHRREVSLEVQAKDGTLTPRALPDPSALDLDRRALIREVWQAIARLRDPYRSTLIMFLDGLSIPEIAAAQHITLTNAKVRSWRAIQMLKTELGQ